MSKTDDNEVSTRGLDTFSKTFLEQTEAGTEDIHITEGQKDREISQLHLERIKEDFIKRAGNFTEDLVGFIIEQKKMRQLDDRAVVFALALANINLRVAYCSPQNKEESDQWSPAKRNEMSKEWERICWGAQSYFDENA